MRSGRSQRTSALDSRGSSAGLMRRARRCRSLWWPWALCSRARRGRLLDDVTNAAGIDLHAGPHGRSQCYGAQVASFRRRRLGPDELLDHGRIVLQQLALAEARLADHEVDDGRAVGAVLDLAGLRLPDRFGEIHGDGAHLGVGHLAGGPEDAPEAADHGHHVRRGDGHVEVVKALLDPFGQVVATHDVGARLFGLAHLLALREDGDLDVLAKAVGQGDRSAQLLVGVADVEPRAYVNLDRLIKRGAAETAHQRDRLAGRVLVLAVDLREALAVAPAMAPHEATSTPIERAVPAMILAACSTSCALRSGSLRSAISRNCCCVIVPTFSRLGSPEPFGIRSAWRISTAAGGVLVMKVKDRSSYTVITIGITVPVSLWVCALNALQNSMMLMPCWPSAGPTGGVGLAWPPSACSVIVVKTFFATLAPAGRLSFLTCTQLTSHVLSPMN